MVKKKNTNFIQQTTLPGQRSAPGGDLHSLFRLIPSLMNPQWLQSDSWRNFVHSVPVAALCRATALSNLLALDWKIVARDSNQQDELKSEIIHYTKIIENTGEYDGVDFAGRIEWLGKDLLDLPFGMAAEIGRDGDEPNGQVRWIRCLDGGTLMPSLNYDFPVIQKVPNVILDPVAFPRHSITRQYWSPRPEIQYEGWGMAPPELIYLVFELMKRGDKYYAELLLNTPQVGILDLGDTTKETAQEWMKEAQDLFVGTDPMKIPVLYEHTTPVNWIPFQMAPNEIMFDAITSRYINLICAGYGMSPSDIGMGGGSNGGETLSGTIRDERRSKRTIQAVLKKKFKSFFDYILPETIEFKWIDFDDDQNVARGRARLANAQAGEIYIRNHIFTPNELRAQSTVDGLITVSVPETLDENSVVWPNSGNTTRPGLIGEKVSAENGGRGEISGAQDLTARALTKVVVSKAYKPIQKLIAATRGMTQEEIGAWKQRVDDALWWREPVAVPVVERAEFDSGALVDKFEDMFDGLSDKLIPKPQPVNVTVNLPQGEPPTVNIEQPNITNEINIPEVKQADIHVEVNPTPIEVRNEINVPAQDAPIINIHQEDKEGERRAILDEINKVADEE
jgi:hypothetical protein